MSEAIEQLFDECIEPTYAATHLVTSSTAGCSSMNDLGQYITGIRTDLHILAAAGQPSPPSMTLQLVKGALSKVTEAAATLAQFEERAPDERTMLNLMSSLERVAYEHKEKKGEKTKLTAAAAHNKKENEQCRYCKKLGHRAQATDTQAGKEATASRRSRQGLCGCCSKANSQEQDRY